MTAKALVFVLVSLFAAHFGSQTDCYGGAPVGPQQIEVR